ncbi:MAG: hypothetical protein U1A77_10340 [Pirellulales bacterium]
MRATHLMSLRLCCIAISLCAASAFGQPADDASEWFVTPLPSGPPTPEDSAARQQVLRQIDKRQAADFRKQVMHKTPAVATGLPADYDIVVYGEYAGRADRLEIQVRGNRARGEYFGTHTERRWAGEAPADALGPLTRQFIYGALTNHMPVAAARLLLCKTDDDAVYRNLCQTALEPVKLDGSDVDSPVADALYAVLAHTSKTPRRRTETAELIRTLLDRIPSDAHETYSRCDVLAVYLGKFGDRRDLDRLESFVRQRSPYLADSAIAGIAYLDGRRASELARQQIVRLLEKSQEDATFRWSVLPYMELFFFGGGTKPPCLSWRKRSQYTGAIRFTPTMSGQQNEHCWLTCERTGSRTARRPPCDFTNTVGRATPSGSTPSRAI